jgi:thiamine kinase-like enzyme
MGMVVASMQRMHRIDLQRAASAGVPPCNRMLVMLQRMMDKTSALSLAPLPAAVQAMCSWVQHHVLLRQEPPLPYPLPQLSPPMPPARALVMCHNDLQVGNMIFDARDGGSVQLIDFEHSGPNMRAYDIGNLLCELCFSYDSSAGGFTANFKRLLPPSARQQLRAMYASSWGWDADRVMDEVISTSCV